MIGRGITLVSGLKIKINPRWANPGYIEYIRCYSLGESDENSRVKRNDEDGRVDMLVGSSVLGENSNVPRVQNYPLS
jgi:hypothetical protein